MERSYFQMVKEFHQSYGLRIEDKPIDFTFENDSNEDDDLFALRDILHHEEWAELLAAWVEEDLMAVADAICDLIYVLCGTAVSLGIPLDECFAEVHRSNMSKMEDGKPLVREDGKILKGKYFTPPDLRKVMYGSSNQ